MEEVRAWEVVRGLLLSGLSFAEIGATDYLQRMVQHLYEKGGSAERMCLLLLLLMEEQEVMVLMKALEIWELYP